MGLSYHDEQSMVEIAVSWRYNQNPDSENGGTENVGRERLDDPIGIQQQSDDLEIVDR